MDNFNTSTPPKNYLVESILVTLFCCLPFGIVGIINAAKVEGQFNSGDVAGANRSSAEAKKWCTWGLITGIIVLACYGIFTVIAIAAGS